jgi:hypothetical protein
MKTFIFSNDAFLAVACEDETLRVFSTVSAQELHELSVRLFHKVNCSDKHIFRATTLVLMLYVHPLMTVNFLPQPPRRSFVTIFTMG